MIDDDEQESAALLRALSAAAIGAIWIDPTRGIPTLTGLVGLRLVALDMKLTDQADDEGHIAYALGLLRQLVSVDNGPWVLLLWTKEEALAKRFQVEFDSNPIAGCEATVVIAKSEVRDVDGEFLVSEIADRVAVAQKSANASRILASWEQMVHDSATRTTQGVMTSRSSGGPLEALTAFTWEAIPRPHHKSLQADPLLIRSPLWEMLNRIHEDHVELLAANPGPDHGLDHSALGQLAKGLKGATLGFDEKCRVNRQLMLGSVGSIPQPGHVYELLGQVAEATGFRSVSLRHSIRQEIGEQTIHLQRVDPAAGDTAKQKARKKSTARGALLRSSTPVLIDITPACDIQQGKAPIRRFQVGLIVPVADQVALKQLKSVYIGPWRIDERNHALAISPRHVLACRAEAAEGWEPLLRLREGVTGDLRAQAAAYSARLGHLALTVPAL